MAGRAPQFYGAREVGTKGQRTCRRAKRQTDLVVISRAGELYFLVAVKDEVDDGVAIWHSIAPSKSGADLVCGALLVDVGRARQMRGRNLVWRQDLLET